MMQFIMKKDDFEKRFSFSLFSQCISLLLALAYDLEAGWSNYPNLFDQRRIQSHVACHALAFLQCLPSEPFSWKFNCFSTYHKKKCPLCIEILYDIDISTDCRLYDHSKALYAICDA